jgi:hypothetical protein
MNSLRRKTTPGHPSPAQKIAARPYDRLSQLPGLIGLWPSEMQDFSAAGTSRILALLRKALRSERSRGRSGNWTYDLNRHLALAESLKAERAHLREMGSASVVVQRATRNGQAARSEKILHLPAAAMGTRIAHGVSPANSRADQPVFLLPILAESSS